jgi:DNA ligase-1
MRQAENQTPRMNPALLASDIPADVTGWWVSEKLDGIRAIWTGTALLTRHGKRLNAPKWFTDSMPDIRLDGELWMGRGTFDKLVSTIQRKNSDWSGVEFHVFDVQAVGTFEERQHLLNRQLPRHVRVVPHLECAGHDALDAMEATVVAAGGEGLVIRRPGSPYRPGRIGDCIKIKRLTVDVDRWQG